MGGGEAEGEEEADSPLSRDPNAGLSPRTQRSRSEMKSDANPSESPGCPLGLILVDHFLLGRTIMLLF